MGLFVMLPAVVSHAFHEPFSMLFVGIGSSVVLTGVLLASIFKKNETLNFKFVIIIVVLCWLLTVVIGAIPYLASGTISSPVDAVFESISGFTTTGATILDDIESVSKSVLFWRSLTHWIGGLGIILVIIAVLPSFGGQAMQLFQTEVSGGAINQKISPRIKKTAMLLVMVYTSITIAEIILLSLGGMNLYESVVHTFGTVAGGGFSVKNASIGYYHSPYIHYVVILFMILSAINFILYCRFVLGDRRVFFRNEEFKFYIFLILLFTTIVTFNIWGKVFTSFEQAFRSALFHVTSVMTTTGYITTDFDLWPSLSKMILFVAMFVGGCVGSTGSAIKVVRVYVLLKSVWLEVIRTIHPTIIKSISIENEVIPHKTVRKIIRFATIYVLVFVIGSVIMSSFNLDMVSAMTATATTLGNVGPGMNLVGATESYSFLPSAAKIVLSFLMMLGRLEIFTLIIIFYPEFWRS